MVALALTMLLAAAAPNAADPIAPAADGKVQCYRPNVEQKTCASTGAYARLPDGSIENRAVVLIAPSPLIVMETADKVTVRAGAICAPFTPADIDGAKFTVNGAPAPDDMADRIKSAMKAQMTGLLGHEICTAYAPDGAGLRAEATVDGKRQPAMDQPVIWVSPQDGYHVGP